MQDITHYTENELSLLVFNDEYFYRERNYQGKSDYVLALVAEEFIYTPEQLEVLKQDLIDDREES